MASKNQQLVLAIFDSEAAARDAAEEMQKWDKANDDVKAGAVGVIAKDNDGKIKEDLMGARAGRRGAKIGAILGVVAAPFTGGLSLLGGVAAGAAGGGVFGSMFHKQLGLSDSYKVHLDRELDGGKAVVGVMATAEEAPAFAAKLAELGGKPETKSISPEAVAVVEAAVAAEATPEEAPEAGAEAVAVAATTEEAPAVAPVAAAAVVAGAAAEDKILNESPDGELVTAGAAGAVVAAAAIDAEDVAAEDTVATAGAVDAEVAVAAAAVKREGTDFSPTSLPSDSTNSETF